MLKPEHDRLSYAEALTPPDGYRLERAVATTYSLDLETLIAAAIPLGLSQELDGEELKCPEALLHAVRKVSDKLVVFCDAGQIRLSGKENKLFPLLDDIVVQVCCREKHGQFPAFHPKTWTLQFVKDDDRSGHLYRFIVLSRNLTFDRSWDVAVTLEGQADDSAVTCVESSRPVAAFLDYLSGRIPLAGKAVARQKSIVRSLSRAVEHVRFRVDMKEFDDFQIMPSGFKAGEQFWKGIRDTQLFCPEEEKHTKNYTFHDLVVVSPFVSSDVMKKLNGPDRSLDGSPCVLITRQDALNSLSESDISGFSVYVMKSDVVFGEESLSDGEPADVERQDLHAKMYLWRKWSDAELFLGSANATVNGLGLNSGGVQNVEMMIRLFGKNRYLNSKSFLNDLFGGEPGNPKNPFEPGVIHAEDVKVKSDSEKSAELAIKKLCRFKVAGGVIEKDGHYSIEIDFGDSDLDFLVNLAPLCAKGMKKPFARRMVFDGLSLEMLTEFFVVEAGEKRCLIKIPLSGIPEKRDAAVLNSIIANRESLCRYLAMVFASNPVYALRDFRQTSSGLSGRNKTVAAFLSGIYEEMLKAAAREPMRIRDAGTVLGQIKSDLPELSSFKSLFEVFARALKITESGYGG